MDLQTENKLRWATTGLSAAQNEHQRQSSKDKDLLPPGAVTK